MSDIVQVNLEGTPDTLDINTGDPTITIVKPSDPEEIVVISPDPSKATVIDDRPEVVISYDFAKDIGQTALLEMLEGALDITEFTPSMSIDLQLMNDLWVRVGNDVDQLLIEADIAGITQTSTSYTDTQIQSTAVDIQALEDSTNAQISTLTQTADAIDLRVTELTTSTDDDFTAQSARIDVTSDSINSNVLRMDGIDDDITLNQANISLQADRITAEVTAREELADGAVTQNTTRSTQTATDLVDVVETNNTLEGWSASAESRLSATEATITIMASNIDDNTYSLQAVESLTANAYSVTITESVGGIQYASGFGLILHPTWFTGLDYVLDYTVTYSDEVYKCILAHSSTIDNSPGSAATATYWVLEADSAQTSFNVQADSFKVISAGSLVDIFSVDGGTGEVSINGDLVLTGSLQSDNYGTAGESYYSLDHSTGEAIFNDMEVSFTGGSSIEAGVLQDSAGNMIIDLTNAEITINTTDGLLIDSSGGMVVDGGVTVNAGGDINLNSTSGDPGELTFSYGGSETARIYTSEADRDDLIFRSASGTYGNDLKFEHWHRIEATATSMELYSTVSSGTNYSRIVKSGYGMDLSHTDSGGSSVISIDGYNVTDNITLTCGSQIKLTNDVMYITSLKHLTDTVALSSTYTSGLSTYGDYFEFINTNDYYFPSKCYMTNAGTFYVRRSVNT